jgi:hypothetical protein
MTYETAEDMKWIPSLLFPNTAYITLVNFIVMANVMNNINCFSMFEMTIFSLARKTYAR